MKVVKPEIRVVFYVPENGQTSEQGIEESGRTCYKSEDRITEGSASKFVRMLRKRGHHAVLEFGYARAHIVADRGLTHELVRHRLASFAQESTRYCNYSKGKFNSEITVIAQPGIEKGTLEYTYWYAAMRRIEKSYMDLIDMGVSSEIARSVLPIGLKAEINIGANLREWRHIFRMRCASAAHPMIRGVMIEALKQFHEKMPAVYEDLYEEFTCLDIADMEYLSMDYTPGDAEHDLENYTPNMLMTLLDKKDQEILSLQRDVCTVTAKLKNTASYPLWVTGKEVAEEKAWDCYEKEGE